MQKQNLFALSLAAALNFAAEGNEAQAQGFKVWPFSQEKTAIIKSADVIPGNPQVGGSLSHLTQNGHPLGNKLNGQYTLVYFGTPYRIASCSADLGVIKESIKIIEQKCGKDIASKITPVFIYPPHDASKQPTASNLTGYINAPGSPYLGLTGTHQQVMDVAAGYKARFMGAAGAQGGAYDNHTRFTYLMNPQGQNLAIFKGDSLYVFMADQIILSMQKEGVIKPSTTPSSCVPDRY